MSELVSEKEKSAEPLEKKEAAVSSATEGGKDLVKPSETETDKAKEVKEKKEGGEKVTDEGEKKKKEEEEEETVEAVSYNHIL